MGKKAGEVGRVRLAHPLAYVRRERGWTHQDLVDVLGRRMNAAARREKAWRWENRGVVPDIPTQQALADELDVPRDLIRHLGWPAWLPAGKQVDLATPWTAEGSIALLNDCLGGPQDQREYLTLDSGAVLALANAWLQPAPSRPPEGARGEHVSEGLMESLENRVAVLWWMDHTLGGQQVSKLVDAELALVTDLLAMGHYSQSLGRQLFAVAAELARVAGWASFDTGLHAAAERYWAAALRAAHVADDRGIGANVLRSMSQQRAEHGRLDEALALAQAARQHVDDRPPQIQAMLAVQQARVHAARGETGECERLLGQAETHMARVEVSSAPTWALYFDHAEFHAQVAACHLSVGHHAISDRWFEAALDQLPGEHRRDRATYYLWWAECAIDLGDVERACALVRQAIPNLAAARSVRNTTYLTKLRQRLAAYSAEAVVRALEDELHRDCRLMPLVKS